MVKSGLEKCIDTHDSDLAATEKNCLYDSEDYASAYLQVLNLNDIIPDPSRDLHSVICRKGGTSISCSKLPASLSQLKYEVSPKYQKIPVTFQIIVVIPNSFHF